MNDRNLLKGLFLVVIALGFGVGALRYPIGSLQRAGPGLFPLLVSSFLFMLGGFIAMRSRFYAKQPMQVTYRNIAIILASLAGFAALSELLNMITGTIFLV